MAGMSFRELKKFYQDHLFNVLMSFWIRFGIDRENGGFFTCFSNEGDKLLSKSKYIWSQGRFLWMLSRLHYAFRDYVDERTAEAYFEAAQRGAKFLKDHALLPNGNCAWVLNEKGDPIIADTAKKEYDLGIAADEFLVYGMAEYARAAESREYFDFALGLFDSVYRRLETGNFKSAPHTLPVGFRGHGKSMTLLETTQELSDVARFFKDPAAERLEKIARWAIGETQENFVRREDQVLVEYLKKDGSTAYDELLGGYFNPGHAVEDAWFMMHFAKRISDNEALTLATEIVRWMTTKGWDSEYGGLFHFCHIEGGKPRGKILEQNRGDHMIEELTKNWDNKLWWVHSEALYALILAYEHTRDQWFMDTYWKYHDYVFQTFPNPNRGTGEWIQIRDRKGQPEDKVVALPVKDPYHITRAFMHLIKSLERIIGQDTSI
ncbi:MAG TPA: AGE family epimerase/isomerase [Spirochaetia bacterium]|nr:AGE family epimerase/isomerase [Spirochaetia bacterium]